MDWWGLPEPFTLWVPIELNITDAATNSVTFVGDLSGSASGFTIRYTNYSGITIYRGLQPDAGLTSKTDTGRMTFNFARSGLASPYNDTLSLRLYAYNSGAGGPRTTILSGGFILSFPTVWFSRESHIRLFGETHDDFRSIDGNGPSNANAIPEPSVTARAGAGFVSGQDMQWTVSYVKSGWEGDLSRVRWISGFTGGTSFLSWPTVPGVAQYLVWRLSGKDGGGGAGTTDGGLYSGSEASGYLPRLWDLVAIQGGNTFSDTNVSPIVSRFRHRNWQLYTLGGLAAPRTQARGAGGLRGGGREMFATNLVNGAGAYWCHSYQLNRNLSGSVSGPYFITFTMRQDRHAFRYSTNIDGSISGGVANRFGVTVNYVGQSGLSTNVWVKHCFQIPSYSSSGYVTIQLDTGPTTFNDIIDDVYMVSFS